MSFCCLGRGSSKKEARCKVLPTQDRPLPHGTYLQWTTRRPDAKCLWCNFKIQTREHLFKNCPQWKSQQKALWAVVRAGAKTVQDLGALRRREMQQVDPRLPGNNGSRKDIGPPVADEEPGSEASESEKREREEYLAQAEEERALVEGAED